MELKMGFARPAGAPGLVLATFLTLAGCASNQMILELHGSVMYEKPRILEVSHTVSDARLEGGAVAVLVTMLGDAGLDASFDISPDIARRQPMEEVEEGRYEGRFSFAPGVFGGPYSITARLSHASAGEFALRDPIPLTIDLLDR